MRRVAIVGSSGGNLYAQGGNNPPAMMREIFSQAGSAGIEIGYILFIAASQSMDNISQNAKAKLYTLGVDAAPVAGGEATLKEVNEEAVVHDKELAELIQNEKIDGIILLSADPSNINQASLKAAAEKGIPIVGTGGTSMANTQKLGAKVISASERRARQTGRARLRLYPRSHRSGSLSTGLLSALPPAVASSKAISGSASTFEAS